VFTSCFMNNFVILINLVNAYHLRVTFLLLSLAYLLSRAIVKYYTYFKDEIFDVSDTIHWLVSHWWLTKPRFKLDGVVGFHLVQINTRIPEFLEPKAWTTIATSYYWQGDHPVLTRRGRWVWPSSGMSGFSTHSLHKN